MRSYLLFFISLLLLTLVVWGCSYNEKIPKDWQLLGFEKANDVNPVLLPDTSSLFLDPIRNDMVRWEGKDVFNPASLVRNDTLFLLYRAEDFVGKYNGTSRIGLAWSLDGLTFNKQPAPVFYPNNDEVKYLEWEGGAEDPRIVEDKSGICYMTYTAYDGDKARLLIATSIDLKSWQKYGSVFTQEEDINAWTKSGAIVSKLQGSKMVATKVNGTYWMYFGDTHLFVATSLDLIHWDPVLDENGNWKKVLSPRQGMFDSDLVEPGPPAILTEKGIVLIYNSRNMQDDFELPKGTYAAGQALYALSDPSKLVDRANEYFFYPTEDYEKTGQVNNVCFVEGLSFYKGKWFLYYGTADSKIAVAVK
ncbi:MAG: glycoside hydrolase family 130 protein [Cyclobacteriaceae bacterium]